MPAGPLSYEMVPLPEDGRRFGATRRVRWGDADAKKRLRLDGIARYLQDVANDDTRDAGHDPAAPWVVRRTLVDIRQPARVGEVVTCTTFSGGYGSRWAERRTSIVGDGGGAVETASLWVYVNPRTGMPAKLDQAFHDTYDAAAAGRTVSARLELAAPDELADTRPWPLRSTDLDGLGHVNNAATWEAVEDELARRDLVAKRGLMEYGAAIEPTDTVVLHSSVTGGALSLWLTVDEQVRAAALVSST